MNKQEIRNEAYQRLFEIEERFGDHNLPKGVLNYYLLLRALYLGNLAEFISEYGSVMVRVESAEEGKMKLGWGRLSCFESEVCAEICNAMEDEYEEGHKRLPQDSICNGLWN